ncbi:MULTISPECIES: hypothetical protein [Nocardia]|uniref:Uncharacterized protein n=1 Tax=Nocardia nova TaxID=37330 RepID=A0A2T2YT89_9NOCA|nr:MULTISPECIES: hypothetical protein [Nocardia]PSR58699.1 hypothetical protein C8259_29610 [Nocardia nova]
MADIATVLSDALDAAFPQDGTAFNLVPFDQWTAELTKLQHSKLPVESIEARCVSTLVEAASDIVALRFGNFLHATRALAVWMEALEIANNLSSGSQGMPPPARIIDCLYELAAVVGSIEQQPELGFIESLTKEFDSHISVAAGRVPKFSSVPGDDEGAVEEVRFAIDELYTQRDNLEWALHAVRFIKLEFATWKLLAGVDDNRIAEALASLDEEMSRAVKTSTDNRWIIPDSKAPKSFWWRHLKSRQHG